MAVELSYDKLSVLAWFLTSAPINTAITHAALGDDEDLEDAQERQVFDHIAGVLDPYRQEMQTVQSLFRRIQQENGGEWATNHIVTPGQVMRIWKLKDPSEQLDFSVSQELEDLRRERDELKTRLAALEQQHAA